MKEVTIKRPHNHAMTRTGLRSNGATRIGMAKEAGKHTISNKSFENNLYASKQALLISNKSTITYLQKLDTKLRNPNGLQPHTQGYIPSRTSLYFIPITDTGSTEEYVLIINQITKSLLKAIPNDKGGKQVKDCIDNSPKYAIDEVTKKTGLQNEFILKLTEATDHQEGVNTFFTDIEYAGNRSSSDDDNSSESSAAQGENSNSSSKQSIGAKEATDTLILSVLNELHENKETLDLNNIATSMEDVNNGLPNHPHFELDRDNRLILDKRNHCMLVLDTDASNTQGYKTLQFPSTIDPAAQRHILDILAQHNNSNPMLIISLLYQNTSKKNGYITQIEPHIQHLLKDNSDYFYKNGAVFDNENKQIIPASAKNLDGTPEELERLKKDILKCVGGQKQATDTEIHKQVSVLNSKSTNQYQFNTEARQFQNKEGTEYYTLETDENGGSTIEAHLTQTGDYKKLVHYRIEHSDIAASIIEPFNKKYNTNITVDDISKDATKELTKRKQKQKKIIYNTIMEALQAGKDEPDNKKDLLTEYQVLCKVSAPYEVILNDAKNRYAQQRQQDRENEFQYIVNEIKKAILDSNQAALDQLPHRIVDFNEEFKKDLPNPLSFAAAYGEAQKQIKKQPEDFNAMVTRIIDEGLEDNLAALGDDIEHYNSIHIPKTTADYLLDTAQRKKAENDEARQFNNIIEQILEEAREPEPDYTAIANALLQHNQKNSTKKTFSEALNLAKASLLKDINHKKTSLEERTQTKVTLNEFNNKFNEYGYYAQANKSSQTIDFFNFDDRFNDIENQQHQPKSDAVSKFKKIFKMFSIHIRYSRKKQTFQVDSYPLLAENHLTTPELHKLNTIALDITATAGESLDTESSALLETPPMELDTKTLRRLSKISLGIKTAKARVMANTSELPNSIIAQAANQDRTEDDSGSENDNQSQTSVSSTALGKSSLERHTTLIKLMFGDTNQTISAMFPELVQQNNPIARKTWDEIVAAKQTKKVFQIINTIAQKEINNKFPAHHAAHLLENYTYSLLNQITAFLQNTDQPTEQEETKQLLEDITAFEDMFGITLATAKNPDQDLGDDEATSTTDTAATTLYNKFDALQRLSAFARLARTRLHGKVDGFFGRTNIPNTYVAFANILSLRLINAGRLMQTIEGNLQLKEEDLATKIKHALSINATEVSALEQSNNKAFKQVAISAIEHQIDLHTETTANLARRNSTSSEEDTETEVEIAGGETKGPSTIEELHEQMLSSKEQMHHLTQEIEACKNLVAEYSAGIVAKDRVINPKEFNQQVQNEMAETTYNLLERTYVAEFTEDIKESISADIRSIEENHSNAAAIMGALYTKEAYKTLTFSAKGAIAQYCASHAVISSEKANLDTLHRERTELQQKLKVATQLQKNRESALTKLKQQARTTASYFFTTKKDQAIAAYNNLEEHVQSYDSKLSSARNIVMKEQALATSYHNFWSVITKFKERALLSTTLKGMALSKAIRKKHGYIIKKLTEIEEAIDTYVTAERAVNTNRSELENPPGIDTLYRYIRDLKQMKPTKQGFDSEAFAKRVYAIAHTAPGKSHLDFAKQSAIHYKQYMDASREKIAASRFVSSQKSDAESVDTETLTQQYLQHFNLADTTTTNSPATKGFVAKIVKLENGADLSKEGAESDIFGFELPEKTVSESTNNETTRPGPSRRANSVASAAQQRVSENRSIFNNRVSDQPHSRTVQMQEFISDRSDKEPFEESSRANPSDSDGDLSL